MEKRPRITSSVATRTNSERPYRSTYSFPTLCALAQSGGTSGNSDLQGVERRRERGRRLRSARGFGAGAPVLSGAAAARGSSRFTSSDAELTGPESSATFASASASRFCSRRTCSMAKYLSCARKYRSALVERLQIRALYLVAPLHLANEQFGIAADAQRRDAVRRRVVEGSEQRVVFGHVVRVAAEFFRKLQDQLAFRIAYHHGVCGGTRVAARSAVNIGDVHSRRRCRWMGIGEETRAARRRSFRSSHAPRPQLSRDVEAEALAWEAEAAAGADETLGSM